MTTIDELEVGSRIVAHPATLGGEPVFLGTRVSVRHVGLLMLRDVPLPEMREDFPRLTDADFAIAKAFAVSFDAAGPLATIVRMRATVAELRAQNTNLAARAASADARTATLERLHSEVLAWPAPQGRSEMPVTPTPVASPPRLRAPSAGSEAAVALVCAIAIAAILFGLILLVGGPRG